MINDCLKHLAALVSMDTQNPPRAIDADHSIIRYIHSALIRVEFSVKIDDLGDGSVCIDATRGAPSLLINCHLDTVPACSGWDADPFTLSHREDSVVGLGACDIKGAAACLLAAAQHTSTQARILFTTDEEAGQSRCIRTWTRNLHPEIKCAFVCEPTGCRAVLAHRGLLSATARFRSKSAHSSCAAAPSSATHDLIAWATAVLEMDSLAISNRFNIGRIDGGTKPNMIADSALARFGLRPMPESDPDELLSSIQNLAPGHAAVEWQTHFSAPALAPNPIARSICEDLNLSIADPVDFWTEAALFAQANVPAVVLGPGDITQAHAPNESVPIAQLEQACAMYSQILCAQTHRETAHATP